MGKENEEVSDADVKEEVKKATGLAEGTMVKCDDGEERPVVTREAAAEAGVNRYFTGIACKKGHMAERKVKGYVCTTCARERQKARHKERLANDPEYKAKAAAKRAAKHKKRYAEDPDYKTKTLAKAKVRRQKVAAAKAEEKAAKEGKKAA